MRITVAAIGEPKGRGPGSAKTPDGKWFKYWTDKITLVKGASYDVETYDKDNNGRTDTFISKAKEARDEAPARSNGHGNGYAPKDERMIFITGVVGRAMGSGQFASTDIKILTLGADDAWNALQAKIAGRAPAQRQDERPHDGGGPPEWQ